MVKFKKTTAEQRREHVKQMNANNAIEGFIPDETDKRLQAEYIDGKITLLALLDHAQQAAIAAAKGGKP